MSAPAGPRWRNPRAAREGSDPDGGLGRLEDRLFGRLFAIQVLVCPRCAGPRGIVGAVTEPHAVRRLLTALGLAPEPPPGPPVPAA